MPKALDPRDLTGRTCVVVGTRPGIIMMSPIIRDLVRRGLPHFDARPFGDGRAAGRCPR